MRQCAAIALEELFPIVVLVLGRSAAHADGTLAVDRER